MKYYQQETLRTKQGLILRHLCLSQYKPNILFKNSAPLTAFIEELEYIGVSKNYIRKILSDLVINEGVKYHKRVEGVAYYYIDIEVLWKQLRKDPTFKLDEDIIKNEYYLTPK